MAEDGRTRRIEIGARVDDGQPMDLPVEEVLQGRAFITGKAGSGKSNSVSVIAEELLAAGYPLLLFDIDGEFVSLKEEYDILHVGGDEFCEKRIGPEHADALAELGIDRRQPIIVDLGGFVEDVEDAGESEVAQSEIVAAIARAFFDRASQAKREMGGKPYLLVCEEMHEFVPQQGGLDAAGRKLVKVGKRGRSRGLGLVGVSQRPSAVDKDFITQCDWLVWHRLTWNNDTRVASDVLGPEYGDAIEDMDDGEAFLQTDWREDVVRVQFRRRETTDLGGAPGLGGGTEVDLKETDTSILDDLDEAAEQARTKDQRIARLEERIEELKNERDEWQEKYEEAEYLADVSADVTGAQLEDLMAEVAGQDASSSVETVTVDLGDESFDVPEVIEAEVLEIRDEKREVESELAEVREERDHLQDRVDELEVYAEQVEEQADLEALRDELAELVDRHESVLETGLDGGSERPTPTPDTGRPASSPGGTEATGQPAPDARVTEFLAHERIRVAVDKAADSTDAAAEHFDRLLNVLAHADDALTAGDIQPMMGGISDSQVHNVARALVNVGLIDQRGSQSRGYEYALDEESIRSQVEIAEQQATLAGGTNGA